MESRRPAVVALFFLATAGMCAVACNNKPVKPTAQAQAYGKPELEFRGIGFKKQSFTGTEVVFKFALVSRDDRPGKPGTCSYKLEFKDAEAKTGTIALSGELPGRGELPVQARVALPWPQERAELLAFLLRKKMPYQFRLSCPVDTPDGPQTASNTDAGSIPLPKLPQMDVLQANAERFGGDDARINFELNMVNDNPFPVRLDKVVYKVFLGDTQVAQGELVLAEVIPPSNAFEYDVATPIFNKQEHKQIMELLSRSQVEYRLEGLVQLGEFEQPLNASGTISFPRGSSD